MRFIVPALVLCAIAAGCANSKKDSTSEIPAMNVAALDVPAAAPPAQYTPAQPVMTEAPPALSEEPADEFASAAEPAPVRSGTKYKVKKGDSLWSIAQARYGSGAKWKNIAAANPGMNPDKIQAGQTINLP